MGSFRIDWKSSAEQELRKIHPEQIPRIIQAVDSLVDDPLPPGCRKLHGAEQMYRIRVGDYRVIYQFDAKKRLMTIYHVRHRKDAYR
jgi:mRNA interferase RelE/StbE